MNSRSVETVIQALNSADVQYLIVGGLAVVAHGYVRFTADVDLVLAVDSDNLTRAVAALKALEYRPFEQFIDAEQRSRWMKEKGAAVFSLFSPIHPGTEIDLFLDPPFDFADTQSRSVEMELAPGTPARFCSVQDLIKTKQLAGRPRDLEDIARLQELGGEEGSGHG